MSYPAYPEYKDSGVEWLGKVPTHWEVKRLRYVAELNPSKSEVRYLPAKSYVSFIPMEAVGDDGSLSLDQTRPINEVLAGYTYVREGDVTIAKITPCFENGKGAVMRGLKNRVGFGTTELTVMRPKAELTTSNYLYRVVSSEPFRVLGESSMYGAGGQKRVPDDFVRNFTIAWPPFKEQAEIQDFLDHETARIDALVEEQQRLIELLKEKRQAVISHAVTKGLDPDVPMKDSGVEWLGEVPEHWGVSKFGFLKTILTDYTANGSFADLKKNVTYLDSPGYARLVRLTDLRKGLKNEGVWVDENAYKYLKKSALFGGEFLLANVGAHAGLFYQMPHGSGPATLAPNMFMAKFDSKKVTPGFIALFAMSKSAQEQLKLLATSSAAQPKLNKDDFKSIVMSLPPLEEQAKIVNAIDCEVKKIGSLVKEAEQGVRLLNERRSALISAAVTGKIDVRNWQPPEEANAKETSQQEAV